MAETGLQESSVLDNEVAVTSLSPQLTVTSIDSGPEDARNHIELIRQERGVDEDIPDQNRSRNFQDLRASCDV
jgi:hypothetical protein